MRRKNVADMKNKSSPTKRRGFGPLARPILWLYDGRSVGFGAKKRTEAFTLIELLVVIAIIALLLAIIMPALRRAKDQSLKVVCSNNLKQIGIGMHIYGVDNDGLLPVNIKGNWVWDLSHSTSDFIMKATGKNKDIFYCPADYTKDGKNRDVCWNFDVLNNFSVTGYFWMMVHDPPLTYNPLNTSDTPRKYWLKTFNERQPAAKDLVTDATLSAGTPPDFLHVHGGLWSPPNYIEDRTNHVRGDKADGGNVLYLDEHVQWRPFSEMRLRVDGPRQYW
jgi:prepilin-type N-terminal cleavage/methylation domain-containing protein